MMVGMMVGVNRMMVRMTVKDHDNDGRNDGKDRNPPALLRGPEAAKNWFEGLMLAKLE